jgi:hypothetical protein
MIGSLYNTQDDDIVMDKSIARLKISSNDKAWSIHISLIAHINGNINTHQHTIHIPFESKRDLVQQITSCMPLDTLENLIEIYEDIGNAGRYLLDDQHLLVKYNNQIHQLASLADKVSTQFTK